MKCNAADILKELGLSTKEDTPIYKMIDDLTEIGDKFSKRRTELLSFEGESVQTFSDKFHDLGDDIKSLNENQIFVFGSNEKGIHGKGAAKTARKLFGAELGNAEGIQGQSYAITTKKTPYEKYDSIEPVRESVNKFIEYAKKHPDKEFIVTEVGTNLAGFS